MPIFPMPIVLMIEANSIDEAQQAIDDWVETLDIETDLPTGTEELEAAPGTEVNDENQRVLFLSNTEDYALEENGDEENDEQDHFNDSQEF